MNTLLNAVDRPFNARLRGSDLLVDFRVLAQSLHLQADDDEARRCMRQRSGDWPAWHVVAGPSLENVEHPLLA
ncbi:MAG: hypothetical protein ACRDQU_18465 [Pseudonocardiaceae bacterium]